MPRRYDPRQPRDARGRWTARGGRIRSARAQLRRGQAQLRALPGRSEAHRRAARVALYGYHGVQGGRGVAGSLSQAGTAYLTGRPHRAAAHSFKAATGAAVTINRMHHAHQITSRRYAFGTKAGAANRSANLAAAAAHRRAYQTRARHLERADAYAGYAVSALDLKRNVSRVVPAVRRARAYRSQGQRASTILRSGRAQARAQRAARRSRTGSRSMVRKMTTRTRRRVQRRRFGDWQPYRPGV